MAETQEIRQRIVASIAKLLKHAPEFPRPEVAQFVIDHLKAIDAFVAGRLGVDDEAAKPAPE